jgi:hypothetical protein
VRGPLKNPGQTGLWFFPFPRNHGALESRASFTPQSVGYSVQKRASGTRCFHPGGMK